MARPLRIEYEGALYHVTTRGNDTTNITKLIIIINTWVSKNVPKSNIVFYRHYSDSITLRVDR